MVGRVLLSESKSKTWFFDSFCEVLSGKLQIPDGESVLGNEALHRAGTVLDAERGTIGFIGRRAGRIIFGVQEASN
jgi:hypothetical protein